MNAATEACTEAWKFQQSEWLYDTDKAIVAVARSWFSTGWTGGATWQASRDTAEVDRLRALIERAHHESIAGDGRSSVVLAVVRDILAEGVTE